MNDELIKKIYQKFPELSNSRIEGFLMKYISSGRSYFPIKFCHQDLTNEENRKLDMIGGNPYTSDHHPWPISPLNDLPMQPIVQINLDDASRLLNFDFGSGLYQLWGHVAAAGEDFDGIRRILFGELDGFLLARQISLFDLKSVPTNVFPSDAPWLLPPSEESDKPRRTLFVPDLEVINNPIAIWTDFEIMYESIQHLPEEFWDDDDLWNLFSSIQEEFLDTWGWKAFLGGWGGGHGSGDTTESRRMLFTMYDSLGLRLSLCFEDRHISSNVHKTNHGSMVAFDRWRSIDPHLIYKT